MPPRLCRSQRCDERKWVAATTDTVIAWTVSGADVVCQWGKYKGQTSYAGQQPITLIPRGVPNHNIANGSIRFGYLGLPDILLSRVASELKSRTRHASALREDLMGFRDDVLRNHLQGYLASAAAASSRLQLEARSLLIVEHLLTVHHGAQQTIDVRRPRGLAPWQLRRTCEAMEARLDGDIGLRDLAQIAGLSPTGLSSQAHGLAQTDLGGALGVSADDASWVVTAGTAAEGAAVIITAPLVAAFGVRRVMTTSLILTAGLAVLIRQSDWLDAAFRAPCSVAAASPHFFWSEPMNAVRRFLITLFVLAAFGAAAWYGWREWNRRRTTPTCGARSRFCRRVSPATRSKCLPTTMT